MLDALIEPVPLVRVVLTHTRRLFVQRFEQKVDRSAGPDGCHLWTAHRDDKGGYGIFWLNGKMRRANRVAWELANGRPVPEGMYVCHRCDNPPCVNPAHLFLGEPTINARDRVTKGRSAAGERAGRAKLTAADVHAMRSRRAAGEQVKTIAAAYGVNDGHASRLIRGLNWTSLEATPA
jgi:hypothetical protein